MKNRLTIVAIFAVLLGVVATTAHAAPDRPPTPPPTDFWQDRHNLGDKYFLNMAHQGGELEAPGNTLYAFKTAVADRGADTLEMDGYMTQDGVFVITHDLSTNPTSNSSIVDPGAQINTRTLAQLKQLDFAYKFRPGTGHYGFPHGGAPDEEYPYRGMANEDGPEPPAGYSRNDFRIATFREVLDALPNTPMNVDMKAPGNDPGMAVEAAEAVAEIMADYPERSEDVIVASFYQPAIEAFHDAYPEHKALSAGESALLSYIQGNPVVPTPVAAQPPDRYNLGGTVLDTVPILKPNTDHDGFAIHVWPANGSTDGPELWQKVKDQGADGFFTDKPSVLHEYLCETGIPRPDGSLRCPEQECPPHFSGYAPNCEPLPCPEGTSGTQPDCQKICPPGSIVVGDECQCPAGTTGTPPACHQIITDPATVVTRVVLTPKKRIIRPGQVVRLRVTVRARIGLGPRVRVNLRSSNRQVRLPKSVVINLRGATWKNAVASRVIRVRATKRARGRAVITARHGKLAARTVLRVRQAPRKARPARR